MKHCKQASIATRMAPSAIALGAFAIWTALVRLINVESIGPMESSVGLSMLNGAFHNVTGVHMGLYDLTDLLSAIPLAIMCAFTALAVIQLLKRKSLRKVDQSLIALMAFYAVLLGLYLGFDMLAINYRPVLIEGRPEPSYPSSTTLLVLGVIPTAIMQLREKIHNEGAKRALTITLSVFAIFMVTARTISGVHWLSDIVGGILLSACLVLAYRAFVK